MDTNVVLNKTSKRRLLEAFKNELTIKNEDEDEKEKEEKK